MGLLQILLENHYLMADIAAADPEAAGGDWLDYMKPLAMLAEAGGTLREDERAEAVKFITDRLPLVAHTSDWKAMRMALSDLHGLDDFLVTGENWRALDESVRQRYADRPAWHREILERAGVETLFWCYDEPELEGPCRSVFTLSGFCDGRRGDVSSRNELVEAFSNWLTGRISALKPVALKIGTAYSRPIFFESRTGRDVDEALSSMEPAQLLSENRVVHDFLHHLAADACAELSLPIQIHTGHLAGNIFENSLTATYAALLETFVAMHPETRFDIFHGSFPQWGEALVLARHYPNVFLNLCWVPSTSQTMAASFLDAALDAVPVNKIMWGGDAHSVEMAYGVLGQFRELLSRVLDRRSEPERLRREAAEWILWKSAAELYDLDAPARG